MMSLYMIQILTVCKKTKSRAIVIIWVLNTPSMTIFVNYNIFQIYRNRGDQVMEFKNKIQKEFSEVLVVSLNQM